MNLIDALNWRYATKRMNGTAVPSEKLNNILEAIRLSASSFGLQPFRAIVVESKELRAKIHETACPQPQIIEGSHVIVFAGWKTINDAHIDEYIGRIAKDRNMPLEALEDFSKMMKGAIAPNTQEQNAVWAAKQAYIALGTGLSAAALENVDATPMEGFNPDAMDKILGLEDKNLHSLAILTLGYRDEANDYLAKAKKVRLPKEDFYISM